MKEGYKIRPLLSAPINLKRHLVCPACGYGILGNDVNTTIVPKGQWHLKHCPYYGAEWDWLHPIDARPALTEKDYVVPQPRKVRQILFPAPKGCFQSLLMCECGFSYRSYDPATFTIKRCLSCQAEFLEPIGAADVQKMLEERAGDIYTDVII